MITWPSIDSRVRTSMLEGYTVRLNAEGRLLEEDPTNNDYAVPAGVRVWVQFLSSRVTPFFEDWRGSRFGFPVHHFVIGVTASVVGGESSQRFGNWSQDFDWDPEDTDDHRTTDCDRCMSDVVTVGGDERLVMGAAASVRRAGLATRDRLGSFTTTIDVQDPDETGGPYNTQRDCQGFANYTPMMEVHDVGEYSLPRAWGVEACIQRLRD